MPLTKRRKIVIKNCDFNKNPFLPINTLNIGTINIKLLIKVEMECTIQFVYPPLIIKINLKKIDKK